MLLIVVWVVGFVLLLRLVAVCRISYLYIILFIIIIFLYILLSLAAALHTNDACDELGPCHKFNLWLRIKKSKMNGSFFQFVYNKICAGIKFNYVWSGAVN